LLQGEPLTQALHLGNALGGIVATQRGATQPVAPSDIAAFLTSNTPRINAPLLIERPGI
jgi:sugar/nucleoside kinase (ribokinase family)